jgi:hypothetical protein
VAELALVAQPLQRGHRLLQDGIGGEVGVAARVRDGFVQVQDVDAVALQALQARFDRGHDGARDVVALRAADAHPWSRP